MGGTVWWKAAHEMWLKLTLLDMKRRVLIDAKQMVKLGMLLGMSSEPWTRPAHFHLLLKLKSLAAFAFTSKDTNQPIQQANQSFPSILDSLNVIGHPRLVQPDTCSPLPETFLATITY